MKKKLLSLILCLCMLTGICGLTALAASAEPEQAEKSAEAPVLDGDAPQVDTVTVTLTLSDEDGASFEGGAKTADIQVYKGGHLFVGYDTEEQLSVCSNYEDLTYFYVPLTLEEGYEAVYVKNIPVGGITEDGSYEIEIVRAYTVTVASNADNRGSVLVGGSYVLNFRLYQGGRIYTVEGEDYLGYDTGYLGDSIEPVPMTGYKLDHWEGVPADGIVNGDLTLTAWFVPIAGIGTAEETDASVSESVDESVANSTDMSKASVTGVKEALDDQIVEFLMSEGVGLSAEDAENSATQVEIDATVNVKLTEGTTDSLTFSVKPTADVTKNGETLAEGAAIPNTYLNKPMTVVIPCGGIVPNVIEHRNAAGELIETFTADGDPAFTYDAASGTVTLQVTEFSSLTLSEGHVHDGVLFDKTLDSSVEGGYLTKGNYYLTEDITLSEDWNIPFPHHVKLCLNGHKVDLNGHNISVGQASSFVLCDCLDDGCITGGGIYLTDGGYFEMNSGCITDGGVYVTNSIFIMTGGCITGNKTDSNGGGAVEVFNGSFTVGGTARITGNTLADGTTASNVYLPTGNTITVQEGFSGKVGVTMESGLGAFTGANSADYSEYFTSDSGNYAVTCSADNVLKLLYPAPTAADFVYESTTGMIYSGEGKTNAFLIGTAKAGIGTITRKVYDSDGKLLTGAPVNAGTYTLKLDIAESATYAGVQDLTDAGWTFSIAPKSVSSLTVKLDHERMLAREYGAEPWLTVHDGETELYWDTDYTLKYENNTMPGTATVTLTGIGNYTGSLTRDYEVVGLKDTAEAKGFSGLTEGGAKKDAVLTLGEGTELTLELIGKAFVSLDGVELTDKECKVEDGCIKVTVFKETLNKLKAGKHVLSVALPEYLMAYDLEFTVSAAEKSASVSDTGDKGHALLWAALLGGCTLCAATLLRKRRG